MEAFIASLIAGAIDPFKLALGTAAATSLYGRRWPIAFVSVCLLIVYLTAAAGLMRMVPQQLIVHMASVVLIVGLLLLVANLVGGAWAIAVGVLLTVLSAVSVWLLIAGAPVKQALTSTPTQRSQDVETLGNLPDQQGVLMPKATLVLTSFGKTVTHEDLLENIARQQDANEPLGSGHWLNSIAAPLYATGRRFLHGDNVAVAFGKEIYRKSVTGLSDPEWQNGGYRAWIEENSAEIHASDEWRYAGTGNHAEAQLLLDHARADARAALVNAARE